MGLYHDENDTSESTHKILTKQTYVEETIEEAPPQLSLKGYLSPASLDEPNPLLERSYLIQDTTLTTLSPVVYINPWTELTRNTPQLTALLSRYRLMRADMVVTVQLSAPVTTYGYVFVTPLYNYTAATVASRGLDYRHLVTAPDAMMLDVSRREMVSITIPYVSPFDYMSLHPVTANASVMDLDNIVVLNARFLRSIVGDVVSPFVNVQVWANFTNVSLAGPMYADGQMKGSMNPYSRVFDNVANTLGVLGSIANSYSIPGSAELNAASELAKNAASITDNMETVVRSVQEVTSAIGVNNEAEPYRVAPWGNLASPVYTQTQQFMGATKVQALPQVPLEGPTQDFNLYSIATLPSFQYGDVMLLGDLVVEPLVPYNMVGWFPNVLDLFRRWRSSIKVHIRFCTSPLVTGRVAVTTTWGNVTTLQLGDTYTENVSIQGTVDHMFTIPYVNHNHWYYSGNEGTDYDNYLFPRVAMEVKELTSSADAIPGIAVLMLVSPAEDLVMQYPQSPFVDLGPVAEGQMNIGCVHAQQKLFPSISGSIPPIVDAPDVTHLSELLNRYSLSYSKYFVTQNEVEFAIGRSWSNPGVLAAGEMGTFDWLVAVFARFTSGSKRFKVEMNNQEEDLVLMNSWTAAVKGNNTVDFLYRPFDGITRSYNGIWQILEFEVPFTKPYTMDPVYESDPLVIPGPSLREQTYVIAPLGGVRDPTLVSSPGNVIKAYAAAGHDFKLHILAPPPRRILVDIF